MRRLFERAKGDLRAFVEQRSDLCLLVICPDVDAALLAQVLGDLDQASSEDLYFLFAHPFERTDSFVRRVVAQLAEEHGAADAGVREAGKPPLPPFPPELQSEERLPPWRRLEVALKFARTLLPRGRGHRLLWAMTPTHIADRDAYLGLVAHLLPREAPADWMRSVRLVVRDVSAAEREHPILRAGAKRTRVCGMDLGPAALAESLGETANDDDAPLAERMQAALSSALLDSAHGRSEQAVHKFKALLDYFHSVENRPMKAFVMNGIGDVFRRMKRAEQALRWYEYALEAVAEAGAPVVLATIVNNLGGVSFEQHKFTHAEFYFDQLDKLSSAMLDAHTKVLALEWRGLSQQKLDKTVDAIKSWEAAAMVSRSIGMEASLQRNLEHLQKIYAKVGLRERAQRVRQELGSLLTGRT